MNFLRSGRVASLAVLMVALVQAACGPMPEETPGAELQAATSASQLVRSEPGRSASTFDVALRVGDKEQSANVELSPEALRALEGMQRASAKNVPVQSMVHERLQRMITEANIPLTEGAKPQVTVKLTTQIKETPGKNVPAEPCIVPADFIFEYVYVSYYPTCTYYVAHDYYSGFYNQCDGSYALTQYNGSALYGPYSCG